MVAKEGLPSLQWPITPRHHVDRDRGLSDLDAELEQLAMDLGGAPQPVLQTHSSDQVAHLLADPRSTTEGTGLPAPVGTDAHSMPTDDRVRPDDGYGVKDARVATIEPDEHDPIGPTQMHVLKLGFAVAQSTVAKYMASNGGPRGQSWGTFLRNHMPHIAAMDLFVVPTIGFDLLYVLVIVRLARRELVWINVTAHPTAEWIAQQITEAFPWHEAPRYLIRDQDKIYGVAVTRRLRAMGIRDKPIAPGSPWQNGFVERLIGTIRRECLDHMIVFGQAHLQRTLTEFAAYYNQIRTHRSLDMDAPLRRATEHHGLITSRPVLGGLHHQYCRI
jgi:hypothetical protein